MLFFATHSAHPILRKLCLALAMLGVLAFVVRGYKDEREVLHFRDFKGPYASARCLLHQCDPYSEAQTHTEFLAAGGIDEDRVPFDPYSALYPPFSLAALTPIAALSFPVTHALWKALMSVLFAVAVWVIADLSAAAGVSLALSLLLAVFAAGSTIVLMLGQISGVEIPLLVIGVACVLRGRRLWLAVVCLFAAAMLKPQNAAFLLLYLPLVSGFGRKTFAAVAGISVVFIGLSLLWIGHDPAATHWVAELRANVAGASAPGNFNSPARGQTQGLNQTHLGAVFAAVRDDPSMYNPLATLVSVLLFAGVAPPLLRLRNTPGKHLLAVAALACFTLLPVYHRQYDTRLLLFAFPAIAYLLGRSWSRAWGAFGLFLLAVATLLTSHQFLNRLMLQHPLAIANAGVARTILLYRPLPAVALVLFVFVTAAMYSELRRQRSTVPVS